MELSRPGREIDRHSSLPLAMALSSLAPILGRGVLAGRGVQDGDTKEEEMVIRLVKFKSALSDAEVLQQYKERAPRYRKLTGLIQKFYIRDPVTGEHGAVYLWDSLESMEVFQKSDLSLTIPEAYQIIGEPRIEVLELVYTLREG